MLQMSHQTVVEAVVRVKTEKELWKKKVLSEESRVEVVGELCENCVLQQFFEQSLFYTRTIEKKYYDRA